MRADPWLAERFGHAVFTFDAGDDPAELVESPAFLQTKVDAGDVARVTALEAAGWRVIDVNLTLRREAAPSPVYARSGGNLRLALARDEDRRGVSRIAAEDYTVSRFHLDPAVPAPVASTIKRDWVGAYFRRERGDRLIVAHDDGEPIGFLAIDRAAEGEVIDLIAVSRVARGRGAGTSLVSRLLGEADGPVLVGTQISNVGAQRFYERLGFRAHRARYVLHRHV